MRWIAFACLLAAAVLVRPIDARPLALRAGKIDPLKDPPEPLATRMLAADERPVWLVQWPRELTADHLRALEKSGARPLLPIPGGAWLVLGAPGGDPGAVAANLPAQFAPRWTGALHPDWKLHPDTAKGLAMGRHAPRKASPVAFTVQTARTTEAERIRKELAAVCAELRPLGVAGGVDSWIVRATPDAVGRLAATNCVIWIEPWRRPELRGERAAIASIARLDGTGSCIDGVSGDYAAWLEQLGLSGAGVIVHVMDDGLSQGDDSNAPGTAHPDILGRIAGIDNGTPSPLGNSIGGHGHINASIILGRPVAGGGLLGPDGLLLGQGIAPDAHVFATKIFSDVGFFQIDEGLDVLTARARRAGAVISSNSWGADVSGEYDALAQLFDALTRDADGLIAGDQPMLFCFAAGNAGPGEQTIGSPATGKNIVCVGASENCDEGPTDGCGVSFSQSDNLKDMIDFSSRGPLADGRHGPTLIAPGVHITGAASDDPFYNGSSVCGRLNLLPGETFGAEDYYPPFQRFYTWSSGTSHSTPLVAGAATLFREWFMRQFGEAPSPALLKAALVAATRDPVGGSRADGSGVPLGPIPNLHAGWGRLDMSRLLEAGSDPFVVNQSVLLGEPGQTWSEQISVSDPSRPLRVVLAWTDAIGALNASRVLVNDLDLTVGDGTRTWHGNVFSGGRSIEGGAPDTLNNLEAVFLPEPGPAVYTITVTATELNGDAVPADGGPLEQDFALLVLNGQNQSPRGRVALDRGVYRCADTVRVSVSDADLIGSGTTVATVVNEAGGDTETLTLSEVAPPSGVLEATIALAGGPSLPGDGVLQVEDGQSLNAVYTDLTRDAFGEPFVSTATARIDCRPPELTARVATALDDESAVLALASDEPATVRVEYGSACGAFDRVVESGLFETGHELKLENLEGCAALFYRVTLTDRAGNSGVFDDGGLCFALQTRERAAGFADDLEPEAADGWTHMAAVGADDWRTTLTPLAHSGDRAWHVPDADAPKDAWLITPAFDVPEGGRLFFWHTYELESAGLFNGYDGAVVELSIDDGRTWLDLDGNFIEGGYGARISDAFGSPLAGRRAWTGGALGEMTRVSVDLGAFAGARARARFRIVCDENVREHGWYLDDVAIVRFVDCINGLAQLAFDAPTLGCEDTLLRLTLRDADLAEGGGEPGPSWTLASRQDGPIPFTPMGLRRVDPAGVWEGFIGIAPGPVAGSRVADGLVELRAPDALTLGYFDADAEGWPQWVSAVAALDCAAPRLRLTRVVETRAESATVRVEADKPATVTLRLATSCGAPDYRVFTGVTGEESALDLDLTGLEPCTVHFYTIELTDAVGATRLFTNQGYCYVFRTTARTLVFDDDLEPGPLLGWTHAAAAGGDDWAATSTPLAGSPVHAWFTSAPAAIKDARLNLPPLTLPPGARLSLRHTFGLESGLSAGQEIAFDAAAIEISTDGGNVWQDLGPFIEVGGYNLEVAEGLGNPLGGRMAWGGGRPGGMSDVRVDLATFEGTDRRIRLRLGCDGSVGGEGWYLDDFVVEAPAVCGAQPPSPPGLVAPVDGAADIELGLPLTFRWTLPTTDVQRLEVYGGLEPDAMTLAAVLGPEARQLTIDPRYVKAGTRFYWQVLAINEVGAAAGAIFSYRTEPVAIERIAEELVGAAPGLNAIQRTAVDYDDSGTVDIQDLITAINRLE